MNENKAPARVLIIVEGVDDERFVDWLAEKCGLRDVEVQSIAGVDKCRRELPALLRRSEAIERTRVVVAVVDADKTPTARRVSYSACLRLHAVGLRQAVYLFPNDRDPGMLEDLCIASMTDDVRKTCREEYIRCLEANGYSGYSRSKTVLQSYVAAHKKSFRHIGDAAMSGDFDHNHADIQKLVTFLRSLV